LRPDAHGSTTPTVGSRVLPRSLVSLPGCRCTPHGSPARYSWFAVCPTVWFHTVVYLRLFARLRCYARLPVLLPGYYLPVFFQVIPPRLALYHALILVHIRRVTRCLVYSPRWLHLPVPASFHAPFCCYGCTFVHAGHCVRAFWFTLCRCCWFTPTCGSGWVVVVPGFCYRLPAAVTHYHRLRLYARCRLPVYARCAFTVGYLRLRYGYTLHYPALHYLVGLPLSSCQFWFAHTTAHTTGSPRLPHWLPVTHTYARCPCATRRAFRIRCLRAVLLHRGSTFITARFWVAVRIADCLPPHRCHITCRSYTRFCTRFAVLQFCWIAFRAFYCALCLCCRVHIPVPGCRLFCRFTCIVVRGCGCVPLVLLPTVLQRVPVTWLVQFYHTRFLPGSRLVFLRLVPHTRTRLLHGCTPAWFTFLTFAVVRLLHTFTHRVYIYLRFIPFTHVTV